MKIHFDGDLLKYRAGFAAEKMHYYLVALEEGDEEVVLAFDYKKDLMKYLEDHYPQWAACKPKEGDTFCPRTGDVEVILHWERRREAEPVQNALYNAKSLINDALKKLDATEEDMTIYLSGPTNFREGIATLKPYKGNRDPAQKPVHGEAIGEYLKKHYDVVVSDGEEADDIVAYSHYAMWLKDPMSSVIVTVDKDLDMVPGLHYNFVTETSYNVSPEEAEYNFMYQLLIGDSTDNIPGVPGIGPVKAANALAEGDRWETIKTLYVQGYEDNWYDALVENGRLLWMRLEPDQWWSPPEELQYVQRADQRPTG